MPEWWNWYTRRPQVPLLYALWVRVPSPVPLLLEEIWNVIFSDAITLVCRLFEYGKKNSVRLSFNQFIAFYKSAPDKWELKDDYVEYIKNRSKVIFCGVVTERGLEFDGVEAVFFRSYHSLLKYRRWKDKLEKAQEERKRNQKTLALSKCWSEDINDAHAKAMRDVQSMFEANLAASKQQERALEVLLQELRQ